MKIATELAGFYPGRGRHPAQGHGQEEGRDHEGPEAEVPGQGAKKKGVSSAPRPTRSSTRSTSSPNTASTSPTAPPTPIWPTRRPTSRPTFPAHFMAALLTSEAERGATAQVVKYINECQDMGIKVLPPDINESDFNFTVAGTARSASAWRPSRTSARRRPASLIGHAQGAGPVHSRRSTSSGTRTAGIVNRKVLESLIKAGAFDSLGWRRSQCFHLIDTMIEYGHEIQKAKAPRQNLLFGGDQLEPPDDPGRGPGDAGVGRVAAPVLREGRPGLLHHRPSAGPVQEAAPPAGLAHVERARRGEGLRRARSGWPGSSARSSSSRRKRTSAWPPSSWRT